MTALLQKLIAKVRSNLPHSQLLPAIRQYADDLATLSDEHLAQQSKTLSLWLGDSEFLDDPGLLVPAAALATEAVRRVMGFRLHDVQLIGGLVIADGRIAEMQTGEGKTLVATFGAYLQSFSGRGVHVATTNDYLAGRDYETATPILQLLGTSVGLLDSDASVDQTREAYACDVTYGSGYQFGFDYLRDQITLRQQSQRPLGHQSIRAIHGLDPATNVFRQRGFAMAIIDEADSVMIDEAMVPLIISSMGSDDESDEAYLLANQMVSEMVEDEHYDVDPQSSAITLTSPGRAKAHATFQDRKVPDLVRPWSKYVENALAAHHRFHCHQHYVVQDGEIQIVDQNTGRIFADRTWRDGLHQAVEAKEGVPINPSQASTSRITRQRFFGFYDRLAGLTGTVAESATEINHFYKLQIVRIPTNVPCQRKQLPSRFFATYDAKLAAIADSVAEFAARRQPVLVGTTTIQQSRDLSQRLDSRDITHAILNGIQDDDEASIVGKAGVAGSVLVATNMAGRGTDIKPCDEAIQLGGLHVIALEHAMSARIDRQLVGRAARQGNPGSCQFFVAADDELIGKYAPELATKMIEAADDQGCSHCDLSAEIAKLQQRIESIQFDMRKLSVQSDVWFDQVRETLH